jgi:AraC-like DNA-binding protein
MNSEILKLLDFAALLLSIVLFTEVLIVCKRPIVLKRILLAITCGYILYNLSLFVQHYIVHAKGASSIAVALITIFSIFLFSYLSMLKIDKLALIIGIFIFISQLLAFIYFQFFPQIGIKTTLEGPFHYQNFLNFIRFFIFVTGILVLNWYYFLKLIKNYNAENIYYAQLRSWAYWFIGTFTMIWFVNQLYLFVDINVFWIILAKKICHLAFLFVVFYRPKFLNHSNYNIVLDGPYQKYKPAIQYDEFLNLFFSKMYYLNENATLEEFCKVNGLIAEDVTNLIAQQYGLSFIEILNKARVDYFISLVASGKHADLNIAGIAPLAGFNSRQNLSKWFKKFHGVSPSDIL